jgi:hypothetical protein
MTWKGLQHRSSSSWNDRGHTIPLGRGWEGVPTGLAEIEFLNDKGLRGLWQWFRGNYLKKIFKEMRDHPYNICNHTERSDPRECIISGTEEAFQ